MAGLGCLIVHDTALLLENLDIASALTLEAVGGKIEPFDSRIQELRPLHGQAHVASTILRLVRDSKLIGSSNRVQDAYSLRCIPQVHGAFLETFNFVRSVVETELNSVTDNPIIIPESRDTSERRKFSRSTNCARSGHSWTRRDRSFRILRKEDRQIACRLQRKDPSFPVASSRPQFRIDGVAVYRKCADISQ